MSKINPDSPEEVKFCRIVGCVSYATGGNAAFDPEYGLSTLNDIRVLLGLKKLNENEMKELFNIE